MLFHAAAIRLFASTHAVAPDFAIWTGGIGVGAHVVLNAHAAGKVTSKAGITFATGNAVIADAQVVFANGRPDGSTFTGTATKGFVAFALAFGVVLICAVALSRGSSVVAVRDANTVVITSVSWNTFASWLTDFWALLVGADLAMSTAVVFFACVAAVVPHFSFWTLLRVAGVGSGTFFDAARLSCDGIVISHQTIVTVTFGVGAASGVDPAGCCITELRIFRETFVCTPLWLSASRFGACHAVVKVFVGAAAVLVGTFEFGDAVAFVISNEGRVADARVAD
jgi:hypothetical protein